MSCNIPSYAVRSLQNGREENEDSYQVMAISPRPGGQPLYLLAVADGMGGHSYGEIVSKEALRKIALSLVDQLCLEPGINQPPGEAVFSVEVLEKNLYEALQQANAHVRRMVESNHWGKAGTTVVVALIFKDTVVVGNLGDSPLIHYQAQGKTVAQRTEDHTVAGVLLRGGLITEEMARFHEGKSRLEFFLGVDRLPKEPPVWHFETAPGDLLLLCSDGISGAITREQIATILSNSALDLEGQADALIQASIDAGETDNQTLILWRPGALAATSLPVVAVQDAAPGTQVEVAWYSDNCMVGAAARSIQEA